MIDDSLRDLYQEVILDHGKNPRHFGPLDEANFDAHGHNPLCGDRIHLFIRVNDAGKVEDISFEGQGCAISIASASMMTDLILGKDVEEARMLAEAFYRMAKGEITDTAVATSDLERLSVMSGVSQFPMRVKCATLAWHTFEAAIDDSGDEEITSE